MAFSYEERQGPQHAHLAAMIKNTSYYLNGSIAVMQRLVRDSKTSKKGSLVNRREDCMMCDFFKFSFNLKIDKRVYDALDLKTFVSKDIKSLQVLQPRASCLKMSRRKQI